MSNWGHQGHFLNFHSSNLLNFLVNWSQNGCIFSPSNFILPSWDDYYLVPLIYLRAPSPTCPPSLSSPLFPFGQKWQDFKARYLAKTKKASLHQNYAYAAVEVAKESSWQRRLPPSYSFTKKYWGPGPTPSQAIWSSEGSSTEEVLGNTWHNWFIFVYAFGIARGWSGDGKSWQPKKSSPSC